MLYTALYESRIKWLIIKLLRCFRNFRSNFEIFQSKILKNSDERYRFLKINRSVPALAIVYTTMVAYANLYPKNELSWSNDRLLLTVTAMFAYHREMRWIWLWLVQFVSIMFFSNNRTISKHFKYLSESFQANMALYRVQACRNRWHDIVMW